MEKIIVYTDGSSRGNPGPGGWGAIIISKDRVQELGGREDHTTNNRMELRSAIEGVRAVPAGATACIYADSEYVVKGITLWVQGWVVKNWKTASKKDVLNQDLWRELLGAVKDKTISWQTVKGHAGVKENERADMIATAYADKDGVDLFDGPRNLYLHIS